MRTTYYEELERAAAREADRVMVFTALRQRRARLATDRLFATLLWLLGVTR